MFMEEKNPRTPGIPGSDSTDADVSEDTTPDHGLSPNDSETPDGSDDTPTPSDDQSNKAQLLEEKRRAVTEAKKRFQEKETARAEAEYFKTAHQVMKSPDTLIALATTNPELAEQIAQENWGISVSEVRQRLKSDEETPTTLSQEDIRKVYREERERERRDTEEVRISQLEDDFVIEHNIDPQSPTFRNIMTRYKKFKPTSVEEAQELLEMAYAKERTVPSSKPSENIDATYSPKASVGGGIKKKTAPSAKVIALGKKLGLTDEYLK